jgi:hypothetical protein
MSDPIRVSSGPDDPVRFVNGSWWYLIWGPYEDESAARQAQEHAEMEKAQNG